MKVILEKPDGSPYITLSDDRLMVSMQIHDYDILGKAVKFTFDRRTIPALIDALSRLQRRELDSTIRTHQQILAGADINSGDGGYEEGTWEKHNEFLKKRNGE